MTAYLFGWNPGQRNPESIADQVRQVERNGSAVVRWRSGNRRSLQPGSRAFLIRLGSEPRGIVGAGRTRTEPDDEPAVEIDFEILSEAPLVPLSVLEAPPFSVFQWSIQASGVAVPDNVAEQLEALLGADQSLTGIPGRVHQMRNAPSADDYVRALTALEPRINERQRRLFQLHYAATDRTASASELAAGVGLQSHAVVNSYYGRLGHQVCDFLGIEPEMRPAGTHRWWSVWSKGWTTPQGFVWRMLPQVAEALERLGWLGSIVAKEFVSPDEVSTSGTLTEGAVTRVLVNAYERSVAGRDRCIEYYGSRCFICQFDFGKTYGEVARGYIHVHHLKALADIGAEYIVDPIADLRPVCPNCHAVLHRRDPPYTVDEVRALLGSVRTPE